MIQPLRRLGLLAQVLFTATLGPTLPCQQPPPSIAPLPVTALTAWHAPVPSLPFTTVLRGDQEHRARLLAGENGVACIELGQLIGLMQANDQRLDEEGVELHASESNLFLRSSNEHIQETRDLLRAVRDDLTSPIRIEVAVIRHDGDLTPPAIVDAGQARGLFEGRQVQWRGAAHTPANVPTSLGRHRRIAYRRTYDGHVSEQREAAVPITDHVFDGVLCNVCPHRLVDGTDLVLQVQFAIGACDEIVEHDPGLGATGKLQRPLVDATAGIMSGRIDNGGALVCTAIAPGDRGGSVTLAVRASWQRPATKLPDDLAILPATVLSGLHTATPEFEAFDRVNSDDYGEQRPDAFESSAPGIDVGMLEELITSTVAPDSWGDTAEFQAVRGVLVVTADESTRAAVRMQLRALQAALVHTVELDYRAGSHRIVMPALAGHGHVVRHGRMTTAVARVEGNIAKAASILVPHVVDVLDGIYLLATPFVHEQAVGASLSWSTQRLDAPPTGARLPTMQRSSRNHAGVLPVDGLPFGDGPFGAEHWRVRLR